MGSVRRQINRRLSKAIVANTEFWLARPTHYWQQPFAPIDGTFFFARRHEDAGLDGLLFFDTQNLAPEALVSLAAAAKETATLGLGTGVTNPMTRHAAVAASAFSALQVVSNGRGYLGIGRGDSALAHLGYAPTPRACSRSTCPISCPTCVAKRLTSRLTRTWTSSTWRTRLMRVGSSGCGTSLGCRWAWRPPVRRSSRLQRGSRTGSTSCSAPARNGSSGVWKSRARPGERRG
ncbi:MAG: LLM class flavin-dependent oxidoreductase [Gammaproteobacteria bacterium]|nr:LLM class flavin-dependent oxidoreductase [Gammaproteobacteria bacterium]